MQRKHQEKSKNAGSSFCPSILSWVVAASVVSVLAIIAITLRTSAPKPVSVMTLNGEPVDVREYRLILNRHRSEVYNDFYLKYGVADSTDFWTTAYEGKTPLDQLKQVTLQDLTSIKVQQLLARQYHVRVALTPQGPFITADPSYAVFLKNLSAENARRQAAVKKGEPIYGPTQFDEDTFYRYFFSKMVEQLQQQLSEGDWKPSTATLEALYAERKETDYRREDTAQFESLCWPYAKPEGKITAESKQEAQLKMEEIRDQLSQSSTFQDIAQRYPVRYADETLDDSTADSDVKYRPVLTGQVRSLPVGGLSQIFESDEGDALCLVTVNGRQVAGYQPFEEVRDQVQARYIDKKYAAVIEQLAREAKIEINQKVYGAIRADG
jgi:hypothetical protein